MKRALLLVLPVAVLAAYLGYQRLTKQEQEIQLVTALVTRGDLARGIDATGRLEAVTTVQVGSQVSGTIKELHADFNSRVRRGQVIARLEPSLFETQVQQAQATVIRLTADAERTRVQYEDAVSKLARARDLAGRQLVPMTDLETAEANAKAAEAGLKAAEAQVAQAEASLNQTKVNLGLTVITAPVDGVVISRNVDVGQTVAASMQAPTLFQIANDLAQMQVSANVDEADIGEIAVGQAVTFQVDAYPGERFSGTVAQVRLSPVIESNVVSYVTMIKVPNADLRLLPGMTATVTIEIARANDILMVPASALRFSPGPEVLAVVGEPRDRPAAMTPEKGAALWTLVDGRLQMRLVSAGLSNGAHVAIVGGGLREGDVIVTGIADTVAAVTPAAGSPLLPQFGRRGGGAARGGTAAGRAGP